MQTTMVINKNDVYRRFSWMEAPSVRKYSGWLKRATPIVARAWVQEQWLCTTVLLCVQGS